MIRLLRIGLPALIAVAGLFLIVAGGGRATVGLGVVLIGTAVAVVAVNLLARLSIQSNIDREREESARRYLDRHGHWPRGT